MLPVSTRAIQCLAFLHSGEGIDELYGDSVMASDDGIGSVWAGASRSWTRATREAGTATG